MINSLKYSVRIYAALGLVILLSLSTFGQKSPATDELKRSFSNFDLVRLDNADLRSSGRIALAAAGRYFELSVLPRDLRSRSYRAEDAGIFGTRVMQRSLAETYMGFVNGDPNSTVRLTIKNGTAEGYFYTNGTRYFVEPANRYSDKAKRDELVVYRSGDYLDEHGFICETDFEKTINKGKESVGTSPRAELEGPGVVEIATEADFQYVNTFGGAAQANNEILSILNMVEGVFQQEMDLSILVVYQHTWSAADPFDGTSATTLLNSFKAHWNTNYTTANYPRDTAHLFSGRQIVASMGFAFVGTVCRVPASAYGLSGYISWAPGKYLITAHEIGHNLNANHVDTPEGCANTIMNPVLSGATPMTFCPYSRTEIRNHVSVNGDCLAPPAPDQSTNFDYDGDSKSDVSVWRPGNGVWYIERSSDSGFDAYAFGQNGDRPIPADYDGDGKTDIAVFRNGMWYSIGSQNGTFNAVPWGFDSDIPAPADFDGDGKADQAVFRPADGIWHIRRSSDGGYFAVQFGMLGDHPIPSDYDGDGKADVNVWRPSNGAWYRLNSSNGAFWAAIFGQQGDKPLRGDFDGDSKSDLAVFRPSSGFWYIYRSTNGSFFGAPFGASTDLPAPGDFDGDGKADLSVFRPDTGVWYRYNSSNGAVHSTVFGTSGDMPTPTSFLK